MIELETDTFDEQLCRAVATRAAMLKRQGIDGSLAYSARVVQELNSTHELERTDGLIAKWCCAAVLALVFVACIK